MRDHQEIDRLLDDALAQYADIEPRPGLERRMLARLSSEEQARESFPWWKIGALGVATLLALLALWLRPVLETVPAPETRRVARTVPPVLAVPRGSGSDGRNRQKRSVSIAPERAGIQPKAERFPSPSPLTEQEKMLARFAQDFPQRAALVARAQTELYQQDQKEMARPWPAKEND